MADVSSAEQEQAKPDPPVSSPPMIHASRAEESYDLCTRFGAPGFGVVLKLADHGVVLAADRIVWAVGDRQEFALLADIASIHLYTGTHSLRSQMGATLCQVRFKTGLALTVYSTGDLGFDDNTRAARYRTFVEDLHRRLNPALRSRIQFVAGYGSARYVVLLVLGVLWSALLLGAVVAIFVLGEVRVRTVVALILGGSMLGALLKLLHVNSPHAYDPSNPLYSAENGSISGTFAHAIAEFRRTLTPRRAAVLWAAGASVIALTVLIVGAQHSANLFEPGRAQHAYGTILLAEVQRKVTKVEVTHEVLLVQFPNGENSSKIEWTASRASLFGWSEWDRVSGPRVNYRASNGDDDRDPFDVQADGAAQLDQLAQAAIGRVGLGQGAVVASMVLRKDYDFAHPEPPRWTVRISDSGLAKAEVIADRHGQLYPATAGPIGPPRIVIRAVPGNAYSLFPANAGTWVRVINPDRSVRFDNTLKVGDSYGVPDVPGLILQTGKPETLEVTVDGHLVSLPRAGYAGRLETVLDPQALLNGRAVRN